MPGFTKFDKIDISLLKENPDNPRTITDQKFEALVASVKNFPQMLEVRPIAFKQGLDGNKVVLGGNMRLRACIAAGMTEVPAIDCSGMTEEQQREFVIRDNVAFGEWEWPAIAAQWPEAADWGLDIPAWANKGEAVEDDYQIPDEIKTDIVLGDLFEIGPHRLLCGDSTKAEDVARVMNGQKADMVFTDPPYDYKSLGKGGAFAKQNDKVKADIDHIATFDPTSFLETLPLYFNNKVLNCFIFCNRSLVPKYLSFAEGNKLSFDILTWHKTTFIPNAGKHHYPDTEYILFIKKSGIFNSGLPSEYYYKYFISDKDAMEGHPTVKPVKLVGLKIQLCSTDNGVIADPFLGSGTTMVAAHQLNRKCYGIEIDPKYCQVIIDRMLKLDPTLSIKKNGVPLSNGIKQESVL